MGMRLSSATALLLLLAVAAPSSAQAVATSFDQLKVLVKAGDTIRVHESNGAEITGRIDSLSANVLTLVAQGRHQELRETDVTRISTRRQDSLLNGAAWGAASGAGTAAILAAVWCEGDCDAGEVTAVTAVYAGLGAAVGVGIDALIVRRRLIFERPARSVALTVSPTLAPGRQGVVVSVGF